MLTLDAIAGTLVRDEQRRQFQTRPETRTPDRATPLASVPEVRPRRHGNPIGSRPARRPILRRHRPSTRQAAKARPAARISVSQPGARSTWRMSRSW